MIRPEAPRLEIHSGPSPGAANSRQGWAKRRGLLVRLRSGENIGLGEASPLPNYSPDSFDEVREALEAWRPPSFEASLSGVRHATQDLPPHLPSARFAAETALLDLLGQELGLPLFRVLLPPKGEDGDGKDSDPWGQISDAANAVLLPLELDDEKATLLAAAKLLARGYRHLKVKIGRPGRFEQELRQLRLLRRMHGDSWQLRLDANGALEPSQLSETLPALEEAAPEFLEEPVPWPALGEITDSPIPLAVDESLATHWPTLEGWLGDSPCAAVVLKPSMLGGVLRCLDIAEKARGLGLATVASHGFDGPIALQATASLALALDAQAAWPAAHGTARHAGLEAWPAIEGEEGARKSGGGWLIEGTRIRHAEARPGLGIRF